MKRSFKLKEIKKEQGDYIGKVYDLNVDKDNSYNVNGSIVHNSACLTTQQTGVGAPMGSLIAECKALKDESELTCKIVADGGIKKYSDIIKAIALGADYVMLGSMLNKALESAGDTYIGNKHYETWTDPGDKVDQFDKIHTAMLRSGTKFYKKLRGMSTKEVQKQLGKEKLKTSEGITKLQPVEYTLEQWAENFQDYLKSAMSYTGARTLEEFRGNVDINVISMNSLKRFEK